MNKKSEESKNFAVIEDKWRESTCKSRAELGHCNLDDVKRNSKAICQPNVANVLRNNYIQKN